MPIRLNANPLGGQIQIGLIADTHIRETSQNLPSKVKEIFQDADIILHAGDIYNPSVLDELELIAPVYAAAGDDDYSNILADRRVENMHVFRFAEKVLWLVHESEYYYTCRSQNGLKKTNAAETEVPDIVVFGHTHYSIVETHCGILFINPGSAMSVKNCSVPGTVAMLRLEPDGHEIEILPVQD